MSLLTSTATVALAEHGDRGRDLVLYFGRRVSGLTLNELARGAGMKEYATVAMAIKRCAVCRTTRRNRSR